MSFEDARCRKLIGNLQDSWTHWLNLTALLSTLIKLRPGYKYTHI